jgi:hypothetical protein
MRCRVRARIEAERLVGAVQPTWCLRDVVMRGGPSLILMPLVFGVPGVGAQTRGDSGAPITASPDSAPTGRLTCTPASVVRGQRVSCLMRSASWNVTDWEFTPDALSEPGASLPIVRERSTSREWAGIAAIGGVVRVYVTNGVEQRTFQARITVTDRPSPWRSKWSYERDTVSSESDELKPPVQEPRPQP